MKGHHGNLSHHLKRGIFGFSFVFFSSLPGR